MTTTIWPSIKDIERYHKKYAPNQKVFDLVYGHCQIVAEIALWCSGNLNIKIDNHLLQTAALLHDIGSYAFFNDAGQNTNSRLYPQHAILGAKILEDEGVNETINSVVATHVLLGLSKQEIIDKPWYLPEHDYQPSTIEGELLCYADCFHSKHPTFNSYQTYLNGLRQNLPIQGDKFALWSKRFGIPDIDSLAYKYSQPVR